MKPPHLGLPRDLEAADATTLERKRIRDRALDERYFQVELWPGAVLYEAGGADAINNNAGVMRLPVTAAGTNPMVHRQTKLLDLWPRARPRLTMWYASPGASTNTFNLRFQLRYYPAGGSTVVATTFSTILTPPGPAVANTILIATVVGGSILPATTAPLRFAIARVGGDSNANDLDILLAVVAMEETA